jgi:hypothetical protein
MGHFIKGYLATIRDMDESGWLKDQDVIIDRTFFHPASTKRGNRRLIAPSIDGGGPQLPTWAGAADYVVSRAESQRRQPAFELGS